MDNLESAHILILDDDTQFCKMMCKSVEENGYHIICRHDLEEGLLATQLFPVDVVLLDVNLPDGSGLEILPRLRQSPQHPDVIIMTGFGEKRGAQIAIHNGAWDYIQKTGSHQKIMISLERVLEYRRQQRQLEKRSRSGATLELDGIIGTSKEIQRCFDQVAKAAGSPTNVLITGLTGTGKEVFARTIHRNSDRAEANMVVVDCAALPETLVESMLFGHIKGAFTGADKEREGLVAQADKGTLFLDEVGEMPLSIQKVFLRVLQERRFRPVGGNREITSDFRLIAATNQDLDKMAADGRFRKDLLYRIRTSHIILPPLCERTDDIEPLAVHYIEKICSRHSLAMKKISPDFFEAMAQYDWPGNVRELINTLETVISGNLYESTLYARHLPESIRLYAIENTLAEHAQQSSPPVAAHRLENIQELPSLKVYRKRAAIRAEKEYLQLLMEVIYNDVKAAQDISGLSRSRFYELIKQHDLTTTHQI
jgi:two-component system NtrC family response regulator